MFGTLSETFLLEPVHDVLFPAPAGENDCILTVYDSLEAGSLIRTGLK